MKTALPLAILIPAVLATLSAVAEKTAPAVPGNAPPPMETVRQRMERIQLPALKYRAMPVEKVLEDIRDLSLKHDPYGLGINMIIKLPPDFRAKSAPLTLSVGPMSVDRALKLIASTSGLYVRVDAHAVVVEPSSRVVNE